MAAGSASPQCSRQTLKMSIEQTCCGRGRLCLLRLISLAIHCNVVHPMQPLSGFAGKLHAASFLPSSLPLFLDYLFAVPYASPLLCRPPAAEEMGYLGRLQLCCHLVRENQASPIGAVKAKPEPKAGNSHNQDWLSLQVLHYNCSLFQTMSVVGGTITWFIALGWFLNFELKECRCSGGRVFIEVW